MTQMDIELQFNPRAIVPGEEIERYAMWAANSSEATRERWKKDKACHLDVPYGDSPLSTLDIFPAEKSEAPIHIFLHGGYWRGRDKSDYSFVADALAPHGITTIVMNYDLCPNVRLDEIVAQVKQGFSWVKEHASDFSGDPALLTASGHSAGAHLVASVLADANQEAVPSAALLISGVYELEPVLHISVNEQIQLRPEMVDALSPMRHPPAHPCRLVVAAGGMEPRDWIAQSRDYAKVSRNFNRDCIYVETPGEHHYSIMNHFASPTGWFSRLAASMARPTSISSTMHGV